MAAFTKQDRLLKSHEFKTTLNWGSKAVTPSMVVFARPQHEGRSRLGLIVSKKVGNSAKRNRVKRMLREVFRDQRPKREVDLVVIARHSAQQSDFVELQTDFSNALNRLHKRLNKGQTTKKETSR